MPIFAYMKDFEDFIIKNAGADTARLTLSTKTWPIADVEGLESIPPRDLAVNTIEARRKLRKKVPEWWANTSLVYPTALCAEQCSSTETASYKAALARRVILGESDTERVPSSEGHAMDGKSGKIIADLTGGLGIDSAAFSTVAGKVLYNEMNPCLAAAARHNFTALGIKNILVSNQEITTETLHGVIGEFSPDMIFLDPARRSAKGNKVFLLEDCAPNVLELIPALFSLSRNILLKLSPMADLSMVTERLNRSYETYLDTRENKGWNGNWVREIHVVAVGGECKELLVWLDKDFNGSTSTICREDGNILAFNSGEIKSARAVLPSSDYLRYVFEPGKSLAKAGALNAICGRLGLVKLGIFTHLYTFAEPLAENEAEERAATLRPYGKFFKVKEVMPLDKASMKEIRKRYPKSEVSAKNIPLSSEELRSRLGVASGNDAMIFGAKVELPTSARNYLIICDTR